MIEGVRMRVQLFTSSAVNTRFGPSDVNGAASDPREMTKAHMQHNRALARLISKMKLGLDMSLLQGSSGVPELPTLDGYSIGVKLGTGAFRRRCHAPARYCASDSTKCCDSTVRKCVHDATGKEYAVNRFTTLRRKTPVSQRVQCCRL